jgi:hypothetical protein
MRVDRKDTKDVLEGDTRGRSGGLIFGSVLDIVVEGRRRSP